MSISTLVLSIADNKQMLGLRYAEWATRAPSLEADIAAAAMGLDDLGHSRVLYGCLEPLGDDPRGPERESDPASLSALPYFDEPWAAWAQFVAANAILDGDTAALHKEGKLSMGPAELKSRLEEQLETKAPAMELSWKGWDARRRRTRPGAVDARTFGMLRGLEEKRFAPASKAQD